MNNEIIGERGDDPGGELQSQSVYALRTWKGIAERRNEVMVMVAQEGSWAKAGGTYKFVRLPMSLIRVNGKGLGRVPSPQSQMSGCDTRCLAYVPRYLGTVPPVFFTTPLGNDARSRCKPIDRHDGTAGRRRGLEAVYFFHAYRDRTQSR